MTEEQRRAYARYMINKRARVSSVDLTMSAREVLGVDLSAEDELAVHDLIMSAAIVVTWPGAADDR